MRKLTTRIGEVNIFSVEPPAGYSLTSGATGPAKLVPYTVRHLQASMAALRDVLASGEPTFALYTRKLAYYSGDVALDNGYYAASEAMIGRSMGAGTDEYALLTDNAFFEFLEPGATEPVMAAKVEPGKCYELILTNAAGLYRYRLGDTVRITRFESGVPIFTYGYRLDETIEVGGTAITEDVLEAVVPAIENASGVDIRDFCAMPEGDHLVVFLEPSFAEGEYEKLLAFDAGLRDGIADVALCAFDAEYDRAREAGAVGQAQTRVLEPQTHLLYRDRTMFTERVAPDQIKPVRTLDTEDKRRFFTTFSMSELNE